MEYFLASDYRTCYKTQSVIMVLLEMQKHMQHLREHMLYPLNMFFYSDLSDLNSKVISYIKSEENIQENKISAKIFEGLKKNT